LYNLYRGKADFIAEWGRGEKAMRNDAVLEESQEASTCDPSPIFKVMLGQNSEDSTTQKHFLINSTS
jgi:hypothetical protein